MWPYKNNHKLDCWTKKVEKCFMQGILTVLIYQHKKIDFDKPLSEIYYDLYMERFQVQHSNLNDNFDWTIGNTLWCTYYISIHTQYRSRYMVSLLFYTIVHSQLKFWEINIKYGQVKMLQELHHCMYQDMYSNNKCISTKSLEITE